MSGDFTPFSALLGGALLGGALLGGAVLFVPSAFASDLSRPPLVLALAGVLVGYGTRLGSGCTSGHGVCGLSRLSARSLASVLTFMLTGALAVHFVAYRLVPRLGSPFLGGRFALPTRRDVDVRLLLGAALFGIGWGIGGYCPGPALVSVVNGTSDALVFFGGLVAGMLAFNVTERATAPAE